MIKPLEYYFEDGSHIKFYNYTIDDYGVIKNLKSGKILGISKQGNYNRTGVYDNCGKQRRIYIGRAIASTFIGPPPSLAHTADHIDRNPDNDILENIRWLCQSGQQYNRSMPSTLKSAFIISNGDIEKTSKEWVVYLKDQKTRKGRKYNENVLKDYACKKQYGFSYKEYPDLTGEVWKRIENSENKMGRWEISNMSRVKFITKHAENVLSGDRLGLNRDGYPVFVMGYCHIVSFMTFFPDKWASKKPGEMVLHENDDKMDFCPHKLRLGTLSDNKKDANDNGSYDGKKNARMKCASYINEVLEREYESRDAAAKYLRSNGYPKAHAGNIGMAITARKEGKVIRCYDRMWVSL